MAVPKLRKLLWVSRMRIFHEVFISESVLMLRVDFLGTNIGTPGISSDLFIYFGKFLVKMKKKFDTNMGHIGLEYPSHKLKFYIALTCYFREHWIRSMANVHLSSMKLVKIHVFGQMTVSIKKSKLWLLLTSLSLIELNWIFLAPHGAREKINHLYPLGVNKIFLSMEVITGCFRKDGSYHVAWECSFKSFCINSCISGFEICPSSNVFQKSLPFVTLR